MTLETTMPALINGQKQAQESNKQPATNITKENEPVNNKISFTKLKKHNGKLTKIIIDTIYTEEEPIKKDSSQCLITKGTGEVIHCNFEELPAMLDDFRHDECICHGVPKGNSLKSSFGVYSEHKFLQLNDKSNSITRTKDNFQFPLKDNHL